MKFLTEFIPLIMKEVKTTTIRKNNKNGLKAGDVIDLTDCEGKSFAKAEIESVLTLHIDIIKLHADILYKSEGFDSADEFLKKLFEFYPENQSLTIFKFKVAR